MVVNAFSIFDAKSGSFSPPFFAFNGAVAQRMVLSSMDDAGSMLGKFPGDYQLFHVGKFDDGTGVLSAIVPVSVCNLISLREVPSAS